MSADSEERNRRSASQWFSELQQCAENYLRDAGFLPAKLKLAALTGDAGFRRYFRINSEPTLIAVYAPPATEKNTLFCQIGEHLRQSGVHTPKVLFHDEAKGYMILEDLGDEQLLAKLNIDTVQHLYGHAFETLLSLQAAPADGDMYEPYSRTILEQEITLFDEWYLAQLLKLNVDEQERRTIEQACSLLVERAQSQTQVVVHRDFHARNLMLQENASLGVIDFQDAVIGPVTYDLVSLLKDCYIRWDKAQVESWALQYLERLHASNRLLDIDQSRFLKDFHLMGLQRHLKVLGIFARLSLRDGKNGYLADLPRVMAYVLEVTAMYAELNDLDTFLRERVLPLAQKGGWA